MPIVKINQIAPEFQVDGTPLAATWWSALISMRIERELNVVGRAVLRFADVGYQLSASTIFAIGSEVKIGVYQGGPLFDGIVTGANLEQVVGEQPELVITVDDKACKLGMDTKVVAHVNKTFTGIVTTMANATGLSSDIDLGAVGESNREYLLQSSTDLAFLDTIVRRANCMWWVDKGTLKVTKAGYVSGAANKIELGTDLLDFSVRASGLRPTKVAVNGWDAEAQADITSPGDTPPPTATSTFADEYTGSKAGMGVNGQLTAGDGNPNDSSEAQALASSLATAWHSAAVVARGTSIVNDAIAPATKVHVASAGPSSGDYTISAVEHIYNRNGFVTKFVAGPVRSAGLVDTLGNDGPDTGFAMTGLITGIVSDANDPNSQGRVKVNYTGAGGRAGQQLGSGCLARRWRRTRLGLHSRGEGRSAGRLRAQRLATPGGDRRIVQPEDQDRRRRQAHQQRPDRVPPDHVAARARHRARRRFRRHRPAHHADARRGRVQAPAGHGSVLGRGAQRQAAVTQVR